MRNEKIITLEDRGKTLTFKIREMPATQLEAWTLRAGLVLANAGSGIGTNDGIESISKYISEHGIAALGQVDYGKAKPLLDEMLGCCYRVIDNMEERVTTEAADAYIEDMRTLLKLRVEAFKVNFSFFGNGGKSATPEEANTIRLNARSGG